MDNQQILSKLKPWVNNNRQWQAFSDYLDAVIEHATQGVRTSQITILMMYRSQGAVATLRKLKVCLRDEVNGSKTVEDTNGQVFQERND